jgi:hypothetical protein
MSLLVRQSTSPLALRVRESAEAGAQLVTPSTDSKALLVRPSNSLLALRVNGLLDPLTAAYATATGATDLAAVDALMRYCRTESLLNNIRLYALKSAQNAGTGSTVFGIGGLTANNMTLVGSPSWGAGGIAFNGSTQAGTIVDFLGSETLTVWSRLSHNPAAVAGIVGQYDTGANQRSWRFYTRLDLGGVYGQDRSSDGTVTTENIETYRSDAAKLSGTERVYVNQWVSGGGRSFWINKTSENLTLLSGTAQTARFNSPAVIHIAATLSNGVFANFMPMTANSFFFLAGPSPTTTQRETLTDLINAL